MYKRKSVWNLTIPKMIDQNLFNAKAKIGINLDRLGFLGIINNKFIGDIDTVIHITASKQINIGLNNLDRRNYNPIHPGTGFLIRNTDVQVSNNRIYGYNYGGEYYCRSPLLNSNINHNLFDSNRIDLLIADSLNPELFTNPGSPVSRIGLQINCNKFYYDMIGIFGAGNLAIQGTMQNDAANDFINNIDRKMMWQNSTANIDYYFKSSFRLRTNPNLCNLCAPHIINGILRYSSNVDSMPTNTQYSCFNTWIILPPLSIDNKEDLKNIEVYPNPFNNHLIVSCKIASYLHTNVIVYDIFGNEIYKDNIYKDNIEINTEKWNAGIYLLKIVDESNMLGQFKLLKL